MESRTPNAWVAWGGLIVAVIAVLISAWQTYETRKHYGHTANETRKHYRYMATPLVLSYVTDDPLEKTWGIFLRNVGVGPAKINYKAVMLDGKPTDMKTIVAWMIQEGALPPKPNGSYLGLKQGSYLGVGDTKGLLKVSPESLEPSALEKFRAFIHQRIDIRLDACSVYEECEPISTKER